MTLLVSQIIAEDLISKLSGGFLADINIWTILIRVALTIICSLIFGIERSNKRHTAGIRTFLIIGLSGAIAALLDVYFMVNFASIMPVVCAALVIAIAIISANTLIYSSRNQIKGLTTSVALWATCFIGMSIGAGFYTIAIIATLIIFVIINMLSNLEAYLKDRSNHFEIHLELKNKTDLQNFSKVIRELGLHIDDIESNPAYLNSGLSVYTISLSVISKELKQYKTHTEIIEALKSLDYVNFIEELYK